MGKLRVAPVVYDKCCPLGQRILYGSKWKCFKCGAEGPALDGFAARGVSRRKKAKPGVQ